MQVYQSYITTNTIPLTATVTPPN